MIISVDIISNIYIYIYIYIHIHTFCSPCQPNSTLKHNLHGKGKAPQPWCIHLSVWVCMEAGAHRLCADISSKSPQYKSIMFQHSTSVHGPRGDRHPYGIIFQVRAMNSRWILHCNLFESTHFSLLLVEVDFALKSIWINTFFTSTSRSRFCIEIDLNQHIFHFY